MLKEEIDGLADRVINSGEGVSREEALNLMKVSDLKALCDAADRICKAFHSNRFDSFHRGNQWRNNGRHADNCRKHSQGRP